MKAIIKIDMSGAAFDSQGEELASLLHDLGEDINAYGAAKGPIKLIDSNGNTCGTFHIEED